MTAVELKHHGEPLRAQRVVAEHERALRRLKVQLLAMVQAHQLRGSHSIISVPMAVPQVIAIPVCCESCRGRWQSA